MVLRYYYVLKSLSQSKICMVGKYGRACHFGVQHRLNKMEGRLCALSYMANTVSWAVIWFNKGTEMDYLASENAMGKY